MQLTLLCLLTIVTSVAAKLVRLETDQIDWFAPGVVDSAVVLRAEGNWNGARVSVVKFTGRDNSTTWELWKPDPDDPSNPPFFFQYRVFGDKCLDVTNGNDVNGNLLQIWQCYEENTNQRWVTDTGSGSDQHLRWKDHNRCIDVRDGWDNKPNKPVQIWDCIDGNTNQQWVYDNRTRSS
ncbi:ricin B-like lectin [Serendipita vermifera]|nr:ricin B-like lectin [Serendipita vermifera]